MMMRDRDSESSDVKYLLVFNRLIDDLLQKTTSRKRLNAANVRGLTKEDAERAIAEKQ
jgi:hypothetical protein